MQRSPRNEQFRAFTRLELIVCCGTIALMLAVLFSARATLGARSDRAICLNNLRQIAVGFAQFGSEHEDRTPWQIPPAQGGNNNPFRNSLFYQFRGFSNYVASPTVLSCPADARLSKRIAWRWGSETNGGFLSPGYLNNSISYFLGVDGTFRMPRSILAGDRNLIATTGLPCSSGIQPVSAVSLATVAWTNEVHGLSGNLLFYDGSVDEVDTLAVRAAFGLGPADPTDGIEGLVHILMPF